MKEDDPSVLAQQLTHATRSGDLAGAYRVLRRLKPSVAEKVALQAGFSSLGTRDRAKFLADLQGQISKAARLHTDGFGLRGDSA